MQSKSCRFLRLVHMISVLWLADRGAALSSEAHERKNLDLTSSNAVKLSLRSDILVSKQSTADLPTKRKRRRRELYVPERPLSPPFPDGPCGGQIVTLQEADLSPTSKGWRSFLLPPRPVHVWLPPGYDPQRQNTTVQYPTLYCHDGQNVVSDDQSWTGRSWRLTGALTRLADHGLIATPLPIVVLLPSMEGDILAGVRRRHVEYGDVVLPTAVAHADWVADTVRPAIERKFSTNPDACYTMGSSLGGQAALHLLVRHPDKFHGAACLSPCFQPGLLAAVQLAVTQWQSPKKIYLDIGGNVGNQTVPWLDVWDHATSQHSWNPGYFWLDTSLQPGVQAMHRILQDAPAQAVQHVYHEIPGGRHNERAWSLRIDKPLRYLFGMDAQNTGGDRDVRGSNNQ